MARLRPRLLLIVDRSMCVCAQRIPTISRWFNPNDDPTIPMRDYPIMTDLRPAPPGTRKAWAAEASASSRRSGCWRADEEEEAMVLVVVVYGAVGSRWICGVSTSQVGPAAVVVRTRAARRVEGGAAMSKPVALVGGRKASSQTSIDQGGSNRSQRPTTKQQQQLPNRFRSAAA